MLVKKLWVTPDPEFQIVRAARICRGSEEQSDSKWIPTGLTTGNTGQVNITYPVMTVQLGPKDKKMLEKMLESNHGAVLRFASAAVSIAGISRVCSHQLVRIAHFGIMQKSQRHVKEDTSAAVVPEGLTEEQREKYLELHKKNKDFYNELVTSGVPIEAARYSLINGTDTSLNMVANFQAWVHFLKLRTKPDVQKETREVALKIKELLLEEAPTVFGSLE